MNIEEQRDLTPADQMFKELGYEKRYDTNDELEYYKLVFEEDDEVCLVINFNKNIQCVFKGVELPYMYAMRYIAISELKAINEKVKELGWLE